MNKKLTILCDLDNIAANLLKKWLTHYNTEYNDNIEMGNSWDMHTWVKPECGHRIYKYLETPNFYRDLELIPGAYESLKELHSLGHNIIISTASANHPSCAANKIEWIREKFPFIGKKHVFIGHQKHLIKGDVFIDDGPINITKYREHWPFAKILTIAYPYNEGQKELTDLYAEDWKNPERAWEAIFNYLKSL